MFPTLGYFKTVDCPLHCSRSHCLYRHIHKNNKKTKSPNPLLENINNAITKLKSDITNHEFEKCINSEPNVFESKKSNSQSSIEYIPSTSVSNQSICVAHGARGSSIFGKNKLKYKMKSTINYHAPEPKIQNDMEYDPVINYSAKEYLSSANDGNNVDLPSKTENHFEETCGDIPNSSSVKRFSSDDTIENEPKKQKIENSDLAEENGEQEIGLKMDLGLQDEENVKNIKYQNKVKEQKISKKDKLKNMVDDIFGVDDNDMSAVANELQTSTESENVTRIEYSSKNKSQEKITKIKSKKIKKAAKEKTKKIKSDVSLTKDDSKKNNKKDKNIDIAKYVSKEEIKMLDDKLSGKNIFDECLMLYNEYEDTAKETKKKKHTKPKDPEVKPTEPLKSLETHTDNTQDFSSPKNKRVAHANADVSAISSQRPRITRVRKSTPAQIMMKRFQSIANEQPVSLNSQSILPSSLPSNNKRLAHNPKNVPVTITKDALKKYRINALNQVATSSKPKSQSAFSVQTKTSVKTNANVKMERSRVAHAIPSNNNKVTMPRITIDRHSKVPTNVRQKCVTMFWKEYLRITKNDAEKAKELTLAEEEQCKQKSNSKIVYMSVCANVVKRLRTLPVMNKKQKANCKAQGLIKKESNTTTIGIYSFSLEENEMELYEKLCHYIMTKDQLEENKYPLPDLIPGQAVIRNLEPLPKPSTSDRKICCRCGQEFIMDKNGIFKHDVQCIYHWGRAYNTKIGHHWEKRYSCCSENIGAPGCCIAEVHVHQDNKHSLKGFVKTLTKSPTSVPGIYALDCEMCYTVGGLELTRVSVVDWNCKIVYDTFVKPEGPVLDYNTRWSGITEKDLKNCKITIRDVQAVFLSKFSADTIFIGHSLESDLMALRIIHSSIIDTAIIFPHKLGHPFKRALRTLMSEYLGIIIQTAASDGHDSHEDAAACMKLMLWKVNEDSKIKGKF